MESDAKELVDLIEQQDKFRAHQYEFCLWPERWSEFRNASFGAAWKTVAMKAAEAIGVPEAPGIYTLVVQPGLANHPFCSYVMYVGKTEKQGLRARFKQYLKKQRRPKIQRLIQKYGDNLSFCYCQFEPVEQVDQAEKDLIAALLPPCNDRLPAAVSKIVGAFQ